MTDSEIVEALESGEIVITPIGSRAEQIQPCSVDLRLSREVMTYKPKSYYLANSLPEVPSIRLGKPLQSEMEPIEVSGAATAFTLAPGAFALGVTVERVKLPANILGRVEGRSSIGRAGLFVHITAGFIDPGFDGRITLEFFNGSPRPIEIPFNFRVCQLALQRLARSCARPYGKARGSKYVGEASDGVQPACEEKAAPVDRVADVCTACGYHTAVYVYDWSKGDEHYACVRCGARSQKAIERSKRWTTKTT